MVGLGTTEVTSIDELVKPGWTLEATMISSKRFGQRGLECRIAALQYDIVCWNYNKAGHYALRCSQPRQCFKCGKVSVTKSGGKQKLRSLRGYSVSRRRRTNNKVRTKGEVSGWKIVSDKGSSLPRVGYFLADRGLDCKLYMRVHIYGIPVIGILDSGAYLFGKIRHLRTT